MPLTLSGTNGVSGVDGTASTPANRGSDTNTGIVYGTDTVQIATGGTTAVTVDSSQRVGIGTAAPSTNLVIGGTAAGAGASGGLGAFLSRGVTTNFYEAYDGTKSFIAGVDNSLTYAKIGTLSSHDCGFITSNAVRALIDSGGNFFVNATSTSSTLGMIVYADASGTYQDLKHTTSAGSGHGYQRFLYNNTVIGQVSQSGTTAVTYATTSDVSLKENITEAENALPSILSLPIRQFDWKSDGSHTDYGVVAQEANEHVPEMVSQGELWSVDYGRVTPRLIKAIQELSAKLDAAEARIAALEAK